MIDSLCQCGCGNAAPIADSTSNRDGWIKGRPKKFVHGHNQRNGFDSELMPQNKFRHKAGYIWTKVENHPRAHNGYVLEHIVVAENKIGRTLIDGETVHHINGKRDDNRPENLRVFSTPSQHDRFHQDQKAFLACGNAQWRKCFRCHVYDSPENMKKYGSYQVHIECKRAYEKAYRLKRKAACG